MLATLFDVLDMSGKPEPMAGTGVPCRMPGRWTDARAVGGRIPAPISARKVAIIPTRAQVSAWASVTNEMRKWREERLLTLAV